MLFVLSFHMVIKVFCSNFSSMYTGEDPHRYLTINGDCLGGLVEYFGILPSSCDLMEHTV